MVPAMVVLIENPTCLAVVVRAVPEASFSEGIELKTACSFEGSDCPNQFLRAERPRTTITATTVTATTATATTDSA